MRGWWARTNTQRMQHTHQSHASSFVLWYASHANTTTFDSAPEEIAYERSYIVHSNNKLMLFSVRKMWFWLWWWKQFHVSMSTQDVLWTYTQNTTFGGGMFVQDVRDYQIALFMRTYAHTHPDLWGYFIQLLGQSGKLGCGEQTFTCSHIYVLNHKMLCKKKCSQLVFNRNWHIVSWGRSEGAFLPALQNETLTLPGACLVAVRMAYVVPEQTMRTCAVHIRFGNGSKAHTPSCRLAATRV